MKITNEDNMELMARYENNHFDLAIVDPPYGINEGKKSRGMGTCAMAGNYDIKDWDNEIPSAEYFEELKRVSKNQVIWGGNYFTEHLKPTKAWIFWYKAQQGLTMSDGEMAWTSLKKVTRMFTLHRTHVWQEKPKHPTQKPVKLYKWILDQYAQKGDKILDTHLGSGSIAVACDDLGFDLDATEIDKEYYNDSIKRLSKFRSQISMF